MDAMMAVLMRRAWNVCIHEGSLKRFRSRGLFEAFSARMIEAWDGPRCRTLCGELGGEHQGMSGAFRKPRLLPIARAGGAGIEFWNARSRYQAHPKCSISTASSQFVLDQLGVVAQGRPHHRSNLIIASQYRQSKCGRRRQPCRRRVRPTVWTHD